MRFFQSKKLILLIFISLLASNWIINYLFDVKESQPPLGFCEEKNRVLTQEEIILAALQQKYQNNSIKSDDSTKTAQAFYNKYPFCCGTRPPAASYPRRSFLTGKLYIKDPGYVVVNLYFPTSEEVMSTPITKCDGKCTKKLVDKNLNYTNSDTPVSNCGGIGSAINEDLNIKDTPFGDESKRASRMQFYEWLRNGRDWRIIYRAQVWEREEHYKSGDKEWEYSEHARF
ncbi:MAG: hypothetical protein WC696_03945 [Candidatus Methylopumilus sp.]|jgi:hypothetical protein